MLAWISDGMSKAVGSHRVRHLAECPRCVSAWASTGGLSTLWGRLLAIIRIEYGRLMFNDKYGSSHAVLIEADGAMLRFLVEVAILMVPLVALEPSKLQCLRLTISLQGCEPKPPRHFHKQD